MIVACLWIVQPFILGFAWAGTIVIATWPVLLKLQKILWGRRSLAVLVMTLLLVLLFVIPVALLVNSIVDGSGPLIHAVTGGDMTLPDLAWLNNIPLVGAKLYAGWHSLLDMGGSAIMAKVRPYIGTTTTWFVGQAAHIGRFMMHCALMLLFSALLYWRGEQVAMGIRHFACRLAAKRGDAAVLLAAQAIRAVALGVVVTALVQAVLGGVGAGDFRRALRYPVDGSDDPFVSGSVGAVAGIDSSHYLALLDRRHHLGHRAAGLERRRRHSG
ncbi:putative inner membrane protein [Salmonella enterica subsp. enterica]|uniref:Putative inner membrane protein n=1 Tax=Salmonella enterica I TaxID=59201 RepID=A0A379WVD3_SALET|nr:putative inner membrane protein [Salmonella enterica subsp. enterica]